MANQTHTPGPWAFQPTEDGGEEWDVTAPFPGLPREDLFVATAHGMGAEYGGPEANARLIAAAPSLLEAGQTVLAGLNARIDRAVAAGEPVPVFDGIAILHDAINAAKAA